MLYGLLLTGYVFVCILLVLLILIQKGKSGSGFGALSTSSQMLFGGSGGQDIFQKTTWILGALFMVGSLALSVMKSQQSKTLSYTKTIQKSLQQNQIPEPETDTKE